VGEMDLPAEDFVLDMNVIATLKELGGDEDPRLFLELVDLVQEDAREQLRALAAAAERGDPRVLERVAHTLKSSCAHVGALAMSRLCSEIEELGRAGRLERIPELVERASKSYERVVAALCAARS